MKLVPFVANWKSRRRRELFFPLIIDDAGTKGCAQADLWSIQAVNLFHQAQAYELFRGLVQSARFGCSIEPCEEQSGVVDDRSNDCDPCFSAIFVPRSRLRCDAILLSNESLIKDCIAIACSTGTHSAPDLPVKSIVFVKAQVQYLICITNMKHL